MPPERPTPQLLDEVQRRRQSIANERTALADARRQNRRVYGPAGTVASIGLAVACVLTGYLVSPVLMLGTLVVGLLLIVLGGGGLCPPEPIAGGIGNPLRGPISIVRWYGRAPKAIPKPLPVPSPFEPEPSVPQLTRELEALKRDERNARLAGCAEQRAAYAIPASRSAAGHLDLIIGASLLVPLGGAVAVFGVGMLNGTDPYGALA